MMILTKFSATMCLHMCICIPLFACGLAGQYLPPGDEELSGGGNHWEGKKENGARPPGHPEDGHDRENCPPHRRCSLQASRFTVFPFFVYQPP